MSEEEDTGTRLDGEFPWRAPDTDWEWLELPPNPEPEPLNP